MRVVDGWDFDIAAIGEILVDFTDCGLSEYGTRLFSQNPGGAVANVAAAASRLGMRTAFIGKVGADMHGEFLRESLAAAGVDTRGLLTDEEYFTTLAFVRLGGGGERSFSFARNFGADTRLSPHELPEDILTGTRLLHFGTIAMTGEPERSAQLRAVELARSAGRCSPLTRTTAPTSGRTSSPSGAPWTSCCPWPTWSSSRTRRRCW